MTKPRQGEIILMNLDPVRGHEQAGYRPVLVVSNSDFNNASNLIIICPITSTNRGKPMDIPLRNTKTTGYILCEHVRAVDLQGRGFKAAGDIVTEETLFRVADIVQGALDVLQPLQLTPDELPEQEISDGEYPTAQNAT